jgi:hypothetical protein
MHCSTTVPGLAGDEAHDRVLNLPILFLCLLLPSVKPMKLQFFVVGSLITFLFTAAGCESGQRSEPAAATANRRPLPLWSSAKVDAAARRYLQICSLKWEDDGARAAMTELGECEAQVTNTQYKPVKQLLVFDNTSVSEFPKQLTLNGSLAICETKFNMPISMDVYRAKGSTVDWDHAYRIVAGPVSGGLTTPGYGSSGMFELDRNDWSSGGTEELASARLHDGWAAMVRPSGFPPLRTIRITTGRPTFIPNGPVQAGVAPATATYDYAVLVAVSPGASPELGFEYVFMRAEKSGQETTLEFNSIATGAQQSKKFYIKSGQYAIFDRSKNTWTLKTALPTASEVGGFPLYVKEAICGALNSPNSLVFFSGATKPACP